TDAVYRVLQWSGLPFSEDMFVKMAMIDSWLVITARGMSPLLINVDTVNDTIILSEGLSNFREYHISLHKWAPVMPPIVKAYYAGSGNDRSDVFHGKLYQFSYRYIYKFGLRSRWSPISMPVDRIYKGMYGGIGSLVTNLNI